MYFMTLAGFPATIAFAGTSFTTTDPAAMITLSPICMLPIHVTLTPNVTLFPIHGLSL